MLHWMAEQLLAIINFVPALIVNEDDSMRFMLIRALFVLLMIVFFFSLIAMRPFRAYLVRCIKVISERIARRS